MMLYGSSGHPGQEGQSRKLVAGASAHSAQPSICLEGSMAMIQGGPSTVQPGDRCVHHPYGVGFKNMKNVKTVGSGRLPFRFQAVLLREQCEKL